MLSPTTNKRSVVPVHVAYHQILVIDFDPYFAEMNGASDAPFDCPAFIPFGYLLLSYSLPILDQQTYRDPTDALMPFYAFKRTKKGPNKLLNAPQRKEKEGKRKKGA